MNFYLTGFHVPKILADLRDQMDFTNGLKEEGIFRLSGSEAEIVSLFAEYTNGSVSHFDAHNAANLMKRWFKSWEGKRLLGEIPLSEFKNSPNIDVVKYLSEPRLSIWKWLLQLLLDCYTFREYNKMSAKNLGKKNFFFLIYISFSYCLYFIAIVWTPALVGTQEDEMKVTDLNETLTLTQYGTTLLEYLIENDGKASTGEKVQEERLSVRKRGHTRSRSVNVVPEEDTIISPRSQNNSSKPLHKRRTPIKRGMIESASTSEPLSPKEKTPLSPNALTSPRFKPPPLLSSSSHSNFNNNGNTDFVQLASIAKGAALPPPICASPTEKKVRKPPPSLQTPLY